MRITIEIEDTNGALTETERAILSLLAGGTHAAHSAPAGQESEEPARAAESAPGGTRRGRRSASVPPALSAGSVFDGAAQTAAAPAAGAVTGDVFGGAPAQAAAAPATEATSAMLHKRVSEVLDIVKGSGLKAMLSEKYVSASGEPVMALRDLQPKDFASFLEDLSVY